MGGLLLIIFKTRAHDFRSLHCREAHGHTYNKRVWEIESNFTSREKEKKKSGFAEHLEPVLLIVSYFQE